MFGQPVFELIFPLLVMSIACLIVDEEYSPYPDSVYTLRVFQPQAEARWEGYHLPLVLCRVQTPETCRPREIQGSKGRSCNWE